MNNILSAPPTATTSTITTSTPTTSNTTYTTNSNIIILEAAIMVEAGWYDIVDELWVSVTSTPITINRLKIRNNLSTEEAEKRINSQIKNEERIKYANYIINTDNKPVEEVEKEVADYYESHILPQIGGGQHV